MSSAYGQQLNKAGIGGTVHKVYTRQVPFTADLTRDMTRNARIAALTGGGAGRFFSFLFHFFLPFWRAQRGCARSSGFRTPHPMVERSDERHTTNSATLQPPFLVNEHTTSALPENSALRTKLTPNRDVSKFCDPASFELLR